MTLLVKKYTKDGAFIQIPKNQTIEAPIRFELGKRHAGQVTSLHHTIFVGAGADVTLIEEYQSGSENYTTHVLTEVHLQKNAKVRLYKYQNEHATATHLSTVIVHQAADSWIQLFNFTTGSMLSRDNVIINQQEKGTECELLGLYCLYQKGQETQQHLQVNHFAEQGKSNMFYKGLLDQNSQAVFNGKVYVAPDTKRINANQANHTILLSKHAAVMTQPELEIYADDVKCSHGATVGQLDDDALFYLRSRGIAQPNARRMLINAFTDEVINQIQHPMMKEEIQLRVRRYVEL